MLTIKNVNAEQAKTYFEKGYYQQGRWFGQAAAQLNLEGNIDNHQAYNNLLDGQSPDGTEQLMGKKVNAKEHRAAIDCTFNAPKSVSLQALVGGDERLIEAHRRAVNQTLELMEARYAQTRVLQKGQPRQIVNAGKMAIAQFDHIETRDLDPHLHTHCVVINVTQRSDGKWRSLHNDAIYRQQKLLGMAYQHNLALEVQKLGYQVVAKGQGQFEIAGYKSTDLEQFSKRRQQILAEAGAEASVKERNRAWGNTRVKKEVVPPKELKARWQREAAELGLSFVTPNPSPVTRQTSIDQKAIAEAISHCSERTVAFRQEELEKFLLNETQPIALSQLQESLAQHPQLIQLSQATENRYTTQAALQRELATIRLMLDGKGREQSILPQAEIATALEQIALTEGQQAAISTALSTTDRVMAWQGVAGAGKTYALNHFSSLAQQQGYIIKGYAPSAEAAKVLADEVGIEANTVASLLCSQPPNNVRSPQVISWDKSGQPEQQRQPGMPGMPGMPGSRGRDNEAAAKSIEPSTTVEAQQIWIVDEAGLLSASAAYDLLKRAKTEKARVLLVGDTRQLSAVEAGNPFKSLQQAGMATAFMNQSLRQRTPELQVAVDLIAKGEIDLGFDRLQEANCLIEVEETEKIERIVADYLAIAPNSREGTLVLAGTNAERLAITQGIRQGLKREGKLGQSVTLTQLKTKDLTKVQRRYTHNLEIGDVVVPVFNYKQRQLNQGQLYEIIAKNQDSLTLKDEAGNTLTVDPLFEKSVYSRAQIEIAEGDYLKWTKNDRKLGRRNGQTFTIKGIEGTQATIEYRDGQQEMIDLSLPQNLDYALVSTTYSSQGKTAERVLISADFTVGQESFYVAVSRVKSELKLYTADRENLRELAKASRAKENPLELLRQKERAGLKSRNPTTQRKSQEKEVSTSLLKATPISAEEKGLSTPAPKATPISVVEVKTQGQSISPEELSVNQQWNQTPETKLSDRKRKKKVTAKNEKISQSQRLADLKNLAALATVIRLIQVLNLEGNNGWRQYEGQRYVYRVAADEQTVELYAKDGRGLILSRRDGKIEGQLKDSDFKQLQLLDEQIEQEINKIRDQMPQKSPHQQEEELEF